MLRRWPLVASMLLLVGLITIPQVVAETSARTFRQQNGLVAYTPPAWFLGGYFIAHEKNPGYVFGPVQDFVSTLGGTTTWLIEDMELIRLEQASADGQNPEYSFFLEVDSPGGTEYWVFVAFPHESAQAWFNARRAFHGRKAEGYYGKTQRKLEHAMRQGLHIKAELRFLIVNGETGLQAPENVIMSRHKFQPVFDLSTGRSLGPDAKIK
ncbi:MAG: hypothetical protein HQ552_06110 [Desulfobacteraceae bacterium]|nr:hypothetical protein [Desulfobacteraceae bacterium]